MKYSVYDCVCQKDYFTPNDIINVFDRISAFYSFGIQSIGPYDDIPAVYELLEPAAVAAFEKRYHIS